MRSILGHPVLAYFRLLEWRARRSPARERVLQQTGLPLTTLDNAALVVIAREPALTVSGLAAATGVSLARASRHAARLDGFGLIERSTSSSDARATTLTLSARGRDVRGAWVDQWIGAYDRALAELDDGERAALESGLTRLRTQLAAEEEFTGLSSTATDPTVAELSPVVAFAQWAAPAITHPSYARRLIQRLAVDLSPQSLFILRALASGGSDTSALAQSTDIDASAVSRHVTRMAHAGLIARAADARDGRIVRSELSHAGTHVLLSIEALELGPISRAMRDWHPTEVDEALASLDRFVAALRVA